MMSLARAFLASLLLAGGGSSHAADVSPVCEHEQITAHARTAFAIYGPLSGENEYFGFIFRYRGRIHSAVTRSSRCGADECVIHVDKAGKLIPDGARVLGEWHTHPHNGGTQLSEHDVRGAYRNRHVRCYTAFYSNPDGEIYAWNPSKTSVPTAMASRKRIGNYGGGFLA
jgi:hypothetical protein